MNYLRSIVTFLSIVLAFSAFAQKGTVKGVVRDLDSKETIPFLNVYTADKAYGTTTDFDGNYSLELDPGTYDITFSSLEYGKTTKPVTIIAGQTVDLDVSLETADIKMETILVKTDKYSKPIEDVISSMEVIKPNIIENKGVTDMSQALEQAPGLTIVDSEPQLRGGSGYSFGAGSRVMVLVDDLPLLTGDAGRPSWGFVPVENIEQVEVIKGASSVLYGSSALNGVINIRTAYPKSEPQTKISLITGVYDAPPNPLAKWWEENLPFYTSMNFFHSRRIKQKFSFVIGGNLYVENGYIGPEPNSTADVVPILNDSLAEGVITAEEYDSTLNELSKEVRKGEFENRMRINFNTRYKNQKVKGLAYGINGNFMYSRSAGSLIWLNNTDGLLRAYPGALTTTIQTTYNFDPFIEYFDQNGNKHSFQTRVFHQNNDNDNDQANKNTVFYGEYRYLRTMKKIPAFTVSAGGVASHTIGKSQLFASDSVVAAGGSAKRTATNVGFYAQLDKKMWDRLNLTLGARWEYFTIDGESDNQPVFRAGASVRALEATYFRTSFGQGFRFPTIAEKFIETTVGGIPIVPNDTLKAEKSWNFEIGVKQGIKIGKFLGYLDVAGFISQYENYVEFIADFWRPIDFGASDISDIGFGFRSTNTGPARVAGVDVSLLGAGNFTEDFGINILAGYTWSRPVSREPNTPFANAYQLFDTIPNKEVTYINTSTDTTNYILKYRFEHLVKADIELNYKALSFGVSFKYYSFMQNVDGIFYDPVLTDLFGIDAKSYREANREPEYVFDFRISVEIAKHSKLAFIINNAFNREYALRPLDMNPHRSFALQYTLSL